MFVHSGKLDHLLEPRTYHDATWFHREQETIFRRGWNFFCLANDLRQPGDRYARQVCGTPVVVVNSLGVSSCIEK